MLESMRFLPDEVSTLWIVWYVFALMTMTSSAVVLLRCWTTVIMLCYLHLFLLSSGPDTNIPASKRLSM